MESVLHALVRVASPFVTGYDVVSNTASSAFSASLAIIGGAGPLPPHPPETTHAKAVVVTGTSAGIGRNVALTLASKGYLVFAGVRKLSDGDSLVKEFKTHKSYKANGIVPVILDVTNKQGIVDARNEIAQKLQQRNADLVAVVNVAGLITLSPIEVTDDKEIRKEFDVNFFGVLDVTKAFLPFLKRTRGRVINIGSAASFITAPSAGIYSASKAAIAAATEALRMELRPLGVGVSLIEPGCIRTRAWDIGIKKLREYNDKKSGSQQSAAGVSTDDLFAPRESKGIDNYAPLFKRLQLAYELAINLAFPPEHITQHVEHALSSRFPRDRYLGGPDVKVAYFVLKFVPQKVVETAVKMVLW
ncbi:hypothetical protein HDU87_000415 [Geranomyces variabilis]|uniref:Uncharacterized protein n=1 Tax=Geranomyces variabilis TaxID=109894 RepID=A0AAD5XT65_9FUNG|nr:hypothetical protein HDU87_000415 [Geranomyces variabilis]